MAVPYHTHEFEIPVASTAEAEAGLINSKVITPAQLQIKLSKSANLSDLEDVAEARGNLGLEATAPGAAGLTILGSALNSDVRNFLDTAPYVATRTAAKALDTTKDTTLILTEAGREGVFKWTTGDFSAEIAADTAEGVYVKADAIASTSGAWVRVFFELASLQWYGAAGDGTTDDTAAIDAALASGFRLTGNGLTYAVTGKISLLANNSLWDAEFKQLAPGASLSVITLEGDTVSGLDLRRVKVDRNGDGTNGGLLDASGTNGALNSAFGMVFDACSDCHFEDLEVYGDDSGTGILFRDIGETSRIIRPYVHDMDWARTAATDDQVQGIWFDQCTRLDINSPKAINLKGVLNGVASRRFTRGVVTGGCNAIRIITPYVETVDQGIDITGATGGPNYDVRVVAGLVKDCYVWGIKLANTARNCVISLCVAIDCGAAGFVVSGNAALTVDETSDRNTFSLCTARDTGSNGQVVYPTIAGFLVISDGTEVGTGARTRFLGCLAIDEQAVPTMAYGFASSAPAGSYQATGEDNESIGHTTSSTNGFIFRIGVVGTVAQTTNTPTRDIIERSTGGADGEWVKFADGTMIARHTIDITATAMTTARGSSFGVAAAVTWTFPGTFVGTPKVSPTFRRNDITAPGSANVMSVSTTSATLNVISAASIGAGNAKFIDVVANGRWY